MSLLATIQTLPETLLWGIGIYLVVTVSGVVVLTAVHGVLLLLKKRTLSTWFDRVAFSALGAGCALRGSLVVVFVRGIPPLIHWFLICAPSAFAVVTWLWWVTRSSKSEGRA